MNGNYLNVMRMPALKQIIAGAEQKILADFGVELTLTPSLKNEVSLIEARHSFLQQEVCNVFNVTWEQILSKSRKNEIVTARHIYIYLCFVMLNFNKTKIARILDKDHTTAINSINVINDFIDIKDGIVDYIESIKSKMLEIQ